MNTKRAVHILLISVEDGTGEIEKVSKLIHLASELSSSRVGSLAMIAGGSWFPLGML